MNKSVDDFKSFMSFNTFQVGEKSLYFNSVNFERSFSSYIGLLVNNYKKLNSLSPVSENFNKTSWKSLLKCGYNSIFYTLYHIFDGERINSVSFNDYFTLINKFGMGKFQIIKNDSSSVVVRVFHSLEDEEYIKDFDSCEYPVAPYTAGIILGLYNFYEFFANDAVQSLSIFETVNNTFNGRHYIEQKRSSIPDNSFSEFHIF